MPSLEVKHPIRFIASTLSGVVALNFVFTAGFVYNNLDRDWAKLKAYKETIKKSAQNRIDDLERILELEKELKRVNIELKRLEAHQKNRDEQVNDQLRHINQRLNR